MQYGYILIVLSNCNRISLSLSLSLYIYIYIQCVYIYIYVDYVMDSLWIQWGLIWDHHAYRG